MIERGLSAIPRLDQSLIRTLVILDADSEYL